ncbi:MAG: GAF domain-containing protein [Chloroflexota bacterium]|nr:GAF domain-containing protein [Chloroflexota bacterium]
MITISSRLLSEPLYDLDMDRLNRSLNGFLAEESIIYAAVRRPTGQIVAEATDGWVPEEQASRILAAQALDQQDIVHSITEEHLKLARPINVGLEQIGTIEIAFSSAALQATVTPMQNIMITLMIVVFSSTALMAIMLVRYVASSIQELAATADAIGRGNLNIPVQIRGMRETAVLGATLEHMRTDLQELYRGLEQQIADLERHTKYMEATAEVARDVTSVLNPQELLDRVAALISERFGFYHTGIFLIDPSGEWAVLQATSSEGGQQMLARGHRLRVGQEGIVGYVTSQGECRIALDMDADTMSSDNQYLPDTRSEMTLPLQARGEIIGALDVQSTYPAAFKDEDMAVLQTLADQVAMAISNAHLFQQAQESLEITRRAYSELSREAWADMLHAQPDIGYYCDDGGITSVTNLPSITHDDGDLPEMSIPILVRDRIIGTIDAHKHSSAGKWTTEEIALLETLTDRLGVALESARLYQDAQNRAARERLTREITDKMRRATNVEDIVQTAVDELFSILKTSRAFVRLGATPPAQNNDANSDKETS